MSTAPDTSRERDGGSAGRPPRRVLPRLAAATATAAIITTVGATSASSGASTDAAWPVKWTPPSISTTP